MKFSPLITTFAKVTSYPALHADLAIFSIKGRVLELGVKYHGVIQLYDSSSGRLEKTVMTDTYGNYEFKSLQIKKYFIVARHATALYNAVIQDNVVPK